MIEYCTKNLFNIYQSYFNMAEPIHIGHIIQEELRTQGRSVTWLARQLGTSRMACYHLLYRISSLLGKNFFEAYSQVLEENKNM